MSIPGTIPLGYSNPPGTSTFSLDTDEPKKEKPSDSDTALPPKTTKLRSACDSCHRSKVRCSGGLPCGRCREFATNCVYSTSARAGKPKGCRSRKTIEREKRAAALNASESEFTASTKSVGADGVPLPKRSASIAGNSSSGTDAISFSTMDADSAATSSSSDMSSMSWTTNDYSQEIGHDGINLNNQVLGISAATYWESNQIWTSNELDADHHFTPELSSPITASYSAFDSLALQRLLPAYPVTSQCHCLTAMAALVPPLTTLVGAMSAERTDQFLLLVRKTSSACNMYCSCTKCSKDAAAISLTTTVIQLVVWLAGKMGVGSGMETPDQLRLQLGTYNVCDDDEQQLLVRGLVACRLRKLLTAAKTLRAAVQGLATNQEEEEQMRNTLVEPAEGLALVSQLTCFDQSLGRLQLCQEGMQP